MIDFEVEGEGRQQVLRFLTNVDDEVEAGPTHPIRVTRAEDGEPSPYIHIRANLEALIDRKTFYRLVELGRHESHEGNSWFGIWSGGQFFPIILSAELA